MLDFNYDEIELISKILNFKIINKKSIFEDKIITEKNFTEKLKTVNLLLDYERLGQIIETEKYFFYFTSNNNLFNVSEPALESLISRFQYLLPFTP